jgi:uncharacterized membrane protein YfcA
MENTVAYIDRLSLKLGSKISCRSLVVCGFALLMLCAHLVVAFEIDVTSSLRNVRRLVSKYSSGEELAEGEILHKDLFPLDNNDWWGTLLVGLGTMIAASGGIGGGAILVPILILVYNFHPKYAIPLSNFTIVGSSITNMVMNLPKRHPDTNRPLVDWDLILVMEPMTMGGAIVGAIAAQILPEWLLIISLVILLAYTTKTTLEKGMQQWNKESEEFAKEKLSELAKAKIAEATSETKSLLSSNDDEDDEIDASENAIELKKQPVKTSSNISQVNAPEFSKGEAFGDFESGNSLISNSKVNDEALAVKKELDELLEVESKTPWNTAILMTVMVGVVIILNLLKGGGGNFKSPLGVTCGSNAYWFLTFLVFVWVLVISFWARTQLVQKWEKKKRLQYKYVKGDIEWNPKNTLIYPAICFFAGFCAGMFGVGGGIVKGPLMLQMGVHPLVASATVAVMIMFTSVAGTVMFVTFGTLTWDYGIFLFIVGFISTAIGQFGVSYLVQKYKRTSLVSFSIGAVVAISTVLMTVQSVFTILNWEEGHGDKQGLCGNK